MANTKKKVTVETPVTLVDTVKVEPGQALAVDYTLTVPAPDLEIAKAKTAAATAELDRAKAINRQLDRFGLVFARTLLSALGAIVFGTILYVALFDTAHVHVLAKDRPAFLTLGAGLAVMFLYGLGFTIKPGQALYAAIGKRITAAILAVPERVRPFVAIILALLIVAAAVAGFVFPGK